MQPINNSCISASGCEGQENALPWKLEASQAFLSEPCLYVAALNSTHSFVKLTAQGAALLKWETVLFSDSRVSHSCRAVCLIVWIFVLDLQRSWFPSHSIFHSFGCPLYLFSPPLSLSCSKIRVSESRTLFYQQLPSNCIENYFLLRLFFCVA